MRMPVVVITSDVSVLVTGRVLQVLVPVRTAMRMRVLQVTVPMPLATQGPVDRAAHLVDATRVIFASHTREQRG